MVDFTYNEAERGDEPLAKVCLSHCGYHVYSALSLYLGKFG